MSQQQINYTHEQNNQPDILKVGVLFVAFGVIGYIWLRTSRELAKEIEKGWNNEN